MCKGLGTNCLGDSLSGRCFYEDGTKYLLIWCLDDSKLPLMLISLLLLLVRQLLLRLLLFKSVLDGIMSLLWDWITGLMRFFKPILEVGWFVWCVS